MSGRRKEAAETVRLPAQMFDAPRVFATLSDGGGDAMWLWVSALLWSRRYETDGHTVPAVARSLARFAGRNGQRAIDALVRTGLWANADGGGFIIAEYSAYADTKAAVRARADVARLRYIPAGTRAEVAAEPICGICGKAIVGPHHVDHIDPVSRGGSSERTNLRRAHARQTDMRPQLEHARAAGAQAVLTYGIGPELAHIANGMARMDWRVPIIGSWTLAMSNFIEIAGRNAEGARMPQTFIHTPRTARQSAFMQAWREATQTARIPVPPAAAQGYDAMLLLAAAIRQAGSLEGARIRDALENLEAPVEGVVMTYHRPFSADNHKTLRSAQQIHLGEIRDGEVVFAREATPYFAFPVKMSDYAFSLDRPPPAAGEHNEAVLHVLGYGEEAIATLKAADAI